MIHRQVVAATFIRSLYYKSLKKTLFVVANWNCQTVPKSGWGVDAGSSSSGSSSPPVRRCSPTERPVINILPAPPPPAPSPPSSTSAGCCCNAMLLASFDGWGRKKNGTPLHPPPSFPPEEAFTTVFLEIPRGHEDARYGDFFQPGGPGRLTGISSYPTQRMRKGGDAARKDQRLSVGNQLGSLATEPS